MKEVGKNIPSAERLIAATEKKLGRPLKEAEKSRLLKMRDEKIKEQEQELAKKAQKAKEQKIEHKLVLTSFIACVAALLVILFAFGLSLLWLTFVGFGFCIISLCFLIPMIVKSAKRKRLPEDSGIFLATCVLIVVGVVANIALCVYQFTNLSKIEAASTQHDSNSNNSNSQKSSSSKSTESSQSSSQEAKPAESEKTDPTFRATMQEYEKFADEYVAIIIARKQNPTDETIIEQYNTKTVEYNEWVKKINSIDTNKLSSADLQYYNEVVTRVNQKIKDAEATNSTNS